MLLYFILIDVQETTKARSKANTLICPLLISIQLLIGACGRLGNETTSLIPRPSCSHSYNALARAGNEAETTARDEPSLIQLGHVSLLPHDLGMRLGMSHACSNQAKVVDISVRGM